MLSRKRIWLRAVALFLLADILCNIFLPTLAYALTAGPTAPEATSFEPVDTTDLVNPSSGDFTYSVPLIEVPGPEGGYPLALSYHSGIQPNEEASWVGLGWSLNPGAITRNVNGYPDDHESITNVVRDYWEGGTQETFTVGLSVGIAGTPASVSGGLSFSQDTYQGFGLGGSLGIGVRKGPLSVGFTVGVDGYGNSYTNGNIGLSHGINLGNTPLVVSANAGLSTDFKSVSSQAGVGLGVGTAWEEDGTIKSFYQPLVGASINSGGGTSFSIVGTSHSSSIHNAKAGNISTTSSNESLSFMIAPGVNGSLGWSYLRYWSDEKAYVATNGSLYFPSTSTRAADLYNKAYDTYDLLDPKAGIVDNPDPAKVMGGSFPDYDNYSVTAQGLAGNIRPYLFRRKLYRQNKKNNVGEDLIKQYNYKYISQWESDKAYFRFTDDFSNKYLYQGGQVEYSTTDPNKPLAEKFDLNAPQTGVYANNQLAGSKHVEYYTNGAIINGTAASEGFINTTSSGFSRDSDSQVGGFMITNESGVTYHYALPAYSYNEIVLTENTNASKGINWNKLTKPKKYAYTWYLTAMTGPDYVDKNTNGLVDESDWGYWVSFEYGKWADDYKWRNPSEGYHNDLDTDFKSHSSGLKEVYYLNAIKTRTHTALFEKEIRADGKSSNRQGSGYYDLDVENVKVYQGDCEKGCDNYTIETSLYFPTASLRLNKIYLLNNKDVEATLKSRSNTYDHEFSTYSRDTRTYVPDRVHYGHNVIDKHDIDLFREQLEKKSIRVVQLNYNYSLCPQTVNSYNSDGSIYNQNPNTSLDDTKLGKLTLTSVAYLGKGAKSLLPPMSFDYDLVDSEKKTDQAQVASDGTGELELQTTSGIFTEGDLVTINIISSTGVTKPFFCSLLRKKSTNSYAVKFLKDIPSTEFHNVSATATTTKNPPYNKEFYDMWGLYKSDFDVSANENISRFPTKVSTKSLDAWSLRRINTALGASIKVAYEADEYKRPVLASQSLARIKSVTQESASMLRITLQEDNINLNDLYSIGYNYPCIIIGGFKLNTGRLLCGDHVTSCSSDRLRESQEVKLLTFKSNTARIIAIDNNSLVIEDADLISRMNGAHEVPHDLVWDALCFGDQFPKIRTDCKLLWDGTPAYIFGGYMFSGAADYSISGGGIRVSALTIQSLNQESITSYDYQHPERNLTSGVTSYEPFGLLPPAPTIPSDITPDQKFYDVFKRESWNAYMPVLSNAREVPGPGVMYEYFTVTSEVRHADGHLQKAPGKVTYQFEVFKEGMIGLVEQASSDHMVSGTSDGTSFSRVSTRKVAIKDYSTRIGKMKRAIQYDADGKKLVETINHFLHDQVGDRLFDNYTFYEPKLASINHQGVIQETFADARFVRQPDRQNNLLGVMSRREDYPAVHTGTTTINHKTGLRTTEQILAYDFYSGVATQSLTTDGYGNRFLAVSVPAYQYSDATGGKPYEKMGLKVGLNGFHQSNKLNKHMLTQTTASYVYKLDATNKPVGLVNAALQTWSNSIPVLGLGSQPTVWRMHENYVLQPQGTNENGIMPVDGPVDYYADRNQMQKTSAITLYSPYSKALEAKDINNNSGATKMGYKDSRVIASATLSNYHEMTFSGAEDAEPNADYFSGEIKIRGSNNIDLVSPTGAYMHTGEKSLRISEGVSGFIYTKQVNNAELRDDRKYLAKAWVRNAGGTLPTGAKLYYKINGQEQPLVATPVADKQANGWYALTLVLPKLPNGGTLEVGCANAGQETLYFDDFRFHPMEGGMIAYVYNTHSGELTHILDGNNLFTHYQYDAAGRLIRMYKELFNQPLRIMAATEHNYANAPR